MNQSLSTEVWLKPAECLSLLNVARATFYRSLESGVYVARKVDDDGRSPYMVLLSSLPIEAQLKYHSTSSVQLPSGDNRIDKTAISFDTKTRAKESLLSLYNDLKAPQLTQKKRDFIQSYNAGALEHLREILGEVSFATIERWKSQYEKGGLTALKERYSRGITSLDKIEEEVILKYLLTPNAPLHSEVVRSAKKHLASLGIELHSDRSYFRFMDDYRRHHNDIYTFARCGEKALNDECSSFVVRDLDRIEVGDVIFADGHTLNFELINPFTGKAKRMTMVLFFDMKSGFPLGYDIVPSENTMAIANALRKSIIMLGFMPRVVYLDNGRAFRSKYFNGTKDFQATALPGLFARLGIMVKYAKPYHGQTKPIERFFKSAEELERRLPSYTGTSIDTKPARMMRSEKFHKEEYSRNVQHLMTIREASEMVRYWFTEFVRREHGSGHQYRGMTPEEIFYASLDRVRAQEGFENRVVNREELDFLMLEERVTTIYRNGIRFNKMTYWNEIFYGMKSLEVVVKYDFIENDSVLVYEPNGDFLCRATATEAHHPVVDLGTDEDKAKLHTKLSEIARLKRGTIERTKQLTAHLASKLPEIKEPETVSELVARQDETQLVEILEKKREHRRLIEEGCTSVIPIIEEKEKDSDEEPFFLYEYEREEYEARKNSVKQQ